MRRTRHILVLGLLVASTTSVARAMPARRMLATGGVSLRVPSGWHGVVSRTPSCDPERLMVVSSAHLRIGSDGTIGAPARGQVIVVVVEDRLVVDRPVGDLRRPARFAVTWNRLTRTEPARFCGEPAAPVFLRYFRARGRYLGFMVYPGAQPPMAVRETTLAVMDSLHVAP